MIALLNVLNVHIYIYIYIYIYICSFRKKSIPLPPGGTVKYEPYFTPGTIANLQTDRVLTKINENGAVVRLRNLVELGIL